MLSVEQMRDIRSATGLSMRYQAAFDRMWSDAVWRLRRARADLGRISITEERGCRRDDGD